MVITDTDLISGIKYAGKNLVLNTQRGEAGVKGLNQGSIWDEPDLREE